LELKRVGKDHMDEKSITTQEFEYGESVVPSQPAKFEQLDQFVRI